MEIFEEIFKCKSNEQFDFLREYLDDKNARKQEDHQNLYEHSEPGSWDANSHKEILISLRTEESVIKELIKFRKKQLGLFKERPSVFSRSQYSDCDGRVCPYCGSHMILMRKRDPFLSDRMISTFTEAENKKFKLVANKDFYYCGCKMCNEGWWENVNGCICACGAGMYDERTMED